jgi:type III pantothenate kinase
VPIKNLYRKPKQVGQDRLVNAYAGVILYGAPLIVVDFGTAITFDAVSKNKEYLGGMILPGLDISLHSLAERTALLPKIKLNKPKEFIGRDTKDSILSGVVYGFAALTDDLTQRIKNRIGKSAKVIGTGGNIKLIRRYCRNIDKVDRDLTLKGLNLIYNR